MILTMDSSCAAFLCVAVAAKKIAFSYESGISPMVRNVQQNVGSARLLMSGIVPMSRIDRDVDLSRQDLISCSDGGDCSDAYALDGHAAAIGTCLDNSPPRQAPPVPAPASGGGGDSSAGLALIAMLGSMPRMEHRRGVHH